MRITPVPCLSDNYAYLVVCEATGLSALVDASEAAPVIDAARALGLGPRDIWSTHHHHDHVGGNEEVVRALSVGDVMGHVSDRGRIPGQTRFLDTGDTFTLGTLEIRTQHIPGHTLGAIAYIVRDPATGETALFTGDTLFCSGCGRLFEGTPAQMHASLQSLTAAGASARVYCGHEYTEANLRFAKHVEPTNGAIDAAMDRARSLRAQGRPTVATRIEDELATNPFLRVRSGAIRRTLGIAADADDATALGAIRRAKDGFRG
jgi:hydroxyacylglutathione hydrolase